MSRTTLVIPNINGIKYIEKCLNSVFASDIPVDVVVIDNNSTDGSREIISEKYPEVCLICHDENTGFCRATNEGIANSKTEFVMFLNNDTEIAVDTVEKLEKVMDDVPKAFSVQALMVSMDNHEVIDSAGDEYCALGWAYATYKGKHIDKIKNKATLRRIFSGCGGACLYRKSILEEIGCLDENHFAYLEDVDLGYRAMIFGYQNYCFTEALVYHAGSATSGSKHNKFKVDLSSRNGIYLLHKDMPLLQIIINLPFLLIGYLIKLAFFSLKGLGGTYIKGIGKGFSMSFAKANRPKKVKFSFRHFKNYFLIQLKLWINIFKRFG